MAIRNEREEFLFKRQLTGWGKIAFDCKEKGIEVINVNPKSRVDVFPKKSIKEIFDEEVSLA